MITGIRDFVNQGEGKQLYEPDLTAFSERATIPGIEQMFASWNHGGRGRKSVGLDVYFRRDIANVLQAMACASEGSSGLAVELLADPELRVKLDDAALGGAGMPMEQLLRVYRRGVRNTLVSVGLAFGLEPVGPEIEVRPGVSPALAGLLWAEIPRQQ